MHVAVPPSLGLGAYSPLKDLGMDLWASGGPWAGRRLVAVNYVLGANGFPMLVGWGPAARLLEFDPPNPLIRAISCRLPVPIPTMADAETTKKPRDADKKANTEMKDTRETMGNRTVTKDPPVSAPTVLGDNPWELSMLNPNAPGLACSDRHSREPVSPSAKGDLV